ncbi:MAG: hypothetical protein RI894_2381 [Bacteroidota bacterium]
MQKQLFLFITLLLAATAHSQPLYVQSNIGADTNAVSVNRSVGFTSKTMQAATNFAAGAGTWQWFGKQINRTTNLPEAAVDTALWRCGKPNQVISAFNKVINPVLWQPSAIRHHNRGGFVGKLPSVTAGKFYTFNIQSSYPVPLVGYKMAVLETDFLPVSLDTTIVLRNSCMASNSPTSPQYFANDTVGIVVNYSNGTVHPNEHIYLAYSDDGFGTTNLQEMTPTAAGRAKATIPPFAFLPGRTVNYYTFTSAKDIIFLRNNLADIDLYSLSLDKNKNKTTFSPNYLAYRIVYSTISYRVSIRTGWKSRNPFCLAYNRVDTLRLYPSSNTLVCDTSVTHSARISYTWQGPFGAPATTSIDTAIFAPITTINAGRYYVTATCSGTGCTTSASIDMTMYPELNPNPTLLIQQSNCTNSSAVVTCAPTGGATPYTYQWRWGVSYEDVVTNIPIASGTIHTVVVTDGNGCTASGTVLARENSNLNEPEILANISKNPKCTGANDGVVGIVLRACTGTNCVYSYAWDTPLIGNTNTSVSNMPPGVYNVTVTNTYTATGGATATCKNKATITIYDPIPLTITAMKVAPTCYRNRSADNGIVLAAVAGGYNPRPIGGPLWPHYSWSNGVQGYYPSAQSISSLSASCYTVTVTDKNNCSVTASACIDSSFTLQTTALAAPTCFLGRTGRGAVAAIPPKNLSLTYRYAWSNPGSNNGLDTARYLGAGTQTVTVTAASGCTASATVTIPDNNAPLSFTLAKSPNSYTCAGQLNGKIAVINPIGDSSKLYTYAWQQQGITILSKNDTLTSVKGGVVYQVTVTSQYGCSATASAVIAQPTTTISPESATTNIRCKGEHNGVMNVTIPNGTASDYNYNWWLGGVNSIGSSGYNQTGLYAGVYGIEVTETATGCKGYADGLIEEPTSALTASLVPNSIQGTTCYGGNDGTASILAQGGAGTYTYYWSPTAPPIAHQTTLEAHTYTVRVTDANGCSKTVTAVIVPGPTQPMSFNMTIRNKACGIEPTGKVCVANIQNATAPYTYSWNTAPSQTDSCAVQLLSGNYVVTVTDNKGCTASSNVTIPSVAVDLTVRDTVIYSGQTVVPYVSTNTADPFTVLWSPPTNVSNPADLNPILSPTSTTIYTLSISKNGCTLDKLLKVTIRYRDGYAIPTAFMPNGSQAENHYFKPLGNGFTLKTFRIFNRWGELLYDNASGNGWDGTFKGEPQASGTYVYLIEYIDQNNQTKQDSGEVTLLR